MGIYGYVWVYMGIYVQQGWGWGTGDEAGMRDEVGELTLCGA